MQQNAKGLTKHKMVGKTHTFIPKPWVLRGEMTRTILLQKKTKVWGKSDS